MLKERLQKALTNQASTVEDLYPGDIENEKDTDCY